MSSDAGAGAGAGALQDNRIYLYLDSNIVNKLFVLCFGISKLQGFDPTIFYLQSDQPMDIVTFTIKPQNDKLCYVRLISNSKQWEGASVTLPIIDFQNHKSVEITKWIQSYSDWVINTSYNMFNIDLYQVTNTKEKPHGMPTLDLDTQFIGLKFYPYGFQIKGTIKLGKAYTKTDYSVEYVTNFYRISKKPMIARVGDSRIGYFYEHNHIDPRNQLSENPLVIINRMNLDNKPWVFFIDRSIPIKYHPSVRSGIISWNRYFNKLGLGRPFKVIGYGDPEYSSKSNIDPFDMKYWYVVGTSANQFNGPYSGYSMPITDHRSGENLFGMISLNLIKIVSIPKRYMIMNGYSKEENRIFESYIKQYVAWITAHEVGHHLGLRHNFMGNFGKSSMSTVMDYVDVFNDLKTLLSFNPNGPLRPYDLIAIKYGYIQIPNERSGIKHPLLQRIADQNNLSFGTDENYWENINPLVNTVVNDDDPLKFVEHILTQYRQYRENLIKSIKNDQITRFDYNNIFTHLYSRKYLELINICLKFIGGKYVDQKHVYYVAIDKDTIIRAVRILLTVIKEIEYSKDESNYFTWNSLPYVTNGNNNSRHQINKSLYSMNVIDIYYLYQTLVSHIFKGLTSEDRIIRLKQNSLNDPDAFSFEDLLFNFTFAYKSDQPTVYHINQINGIFPEIGALLDNNPKWTSMLLETTRLRMTMQFSWINHLILHKVSAPNYELREMIFKIFSILNRVISVVIISYITSLNLKTTDKIFWKNYKYQLLNHWLLILSHTKSVLTK